MLLKIAQLGQPVLRQVAVPVSAEEIQSADFQRLVDDMLATLVEARGVGLAGPQVFQGRRLFLADVLPPKESESEESESKAATEVFINPRIVAASAEKASAWEGCLSFPELLVLVPRPQAVLVTYLNRQGEPRTLELHGFPARVIQHEADHLDGILTIDRAASTRHIIKASEVKDVDQDLDSQGTIDPGSAP